jgi:hypothetical protein
MEGIRESSELSRSDFYVDEVAREEPRDALILGVCGDFEVFIFAGLGSRAGLNLAN